MGYAQSELDSEGGSVIVTPQFIGVGTEDGAYDIQTIKCGEDALDCVFLNTLYNDGTTCDTYDWMEYKGTPCWVDESTGKPAEVSFLPGQAFWVQADEADLPFQSSGEVSTKDIVVSLDDEGGSIMCGNTTPVAISIQDVLCEEEAVDLVFLNTLYNDGTTCDTYDWMEYKGTPCWVDESTGKPADVTLEPGQAFWVQSDEAGFTITFPGVEL